MAKSASTVYGFSLSKSLYGVNNPASLDFIIAASSTVSIGDAVRLDTDGYLVRCSAGETVLGIVSGLIDKDGINVFSPRAQGTTGATLSPDDTVAVSSTNESDTTRNLKAQVILDPAGAYLWKNTTDGTLAQTNLGQFFDIGAIAGQVTATGYDTTYQFQLVQLEPSDTSVGYFRIAESQLLNA